MNKSSQLAIAAMMGMALSGLSDATARRAQSLAKQLGRGASEAGRAENAKAIAGKPWKFPRKPLRARRREAFAQRRRQAMSRVLARREQREFQAMEF